MAYPTVDQFRQQLFEQPFEALVENYVFQGVPFIFRDNPQLQSVMRNHLGSALSISEDNIVIVGSAKIGFSLNPENFPRPFSDRSDIDVLVIDKDLYDSIWITILQWHYPRKGSNLGGTDGGWARARRKDLYWGSIMPGRIRYEGLSLPDALKPLRDISTMWFDAYQSLSLKSEFSSREVSGKLYRTWKHAMLYHTNSLRIIKRRISDHT